MKILCNATNKESRLPWSAKTTIFQQQQLHNHTTATEGFVQHRFHVLPSGLYETFAMYPGNITIQWSRKGESRYLVLFIYKSVKMM